MSDTNDTEGSTPSTESSVNLYNTYGLATQGFVWAAISSVSGDWGKGYVRTVNNVSADENQNVGVASISSLDYSGDLNQINSDFSAVIAGESGHKVLSDKDETKIRTDIQTQFDSVCAIFPSEATSGNKLADRQYVIAQIDAKVNSYRGSWSNWSSVPTNSEQYPEDATGNRIPKNGDYIVILNVSDYPVRTITGTWRFRYVGNWETYGKNGWVSEYEMSSISFTESQWSAINSGITQEKLTSFISSSARWDNASTMLETISSGLYNISFEVETTSANNRMVFSTVSSASSNWNNAFAEVSSTSANNRSAYDTLSSLSGGWNNAFTEISSVSAHYHSSVGNWDNAFSEVSTTSAEYRAAITEVESSSANWNDTYASRGKWDDTYTVVSAHSAIWDESSGSTKKYTDMIGTSALTSAKKYTDEQIAIVDGKIDNIYASFQSSSSNWNAATTEVSSTSANYRSAYANFSESSGNWENVYTAFVASSGRWEDATTVVETNSASWISLSGVTKTYIDTVATSALTSANEYTDAKLSDKEDKITSEGILYANPSNSSTHIRAASADVDYAKSKIFNENYQSISADRNVVKGRHLIECGWCPSHTEIPEEPVVGDKYHGDIGWFDNGGESEGHWISTEYTWNNEQWVGIDDIMQGDIYNYNALSLTFPEGIETRREWIYDTDTLALTSEVNSALNSAKSYTDSSISALNRTVTYDVAWNSTSGISDYSRVFGTARNGDVIILKKQLFEGATDNYKFTSFTYYNNSWMAMNGDYNTENVFFTENLTATTDVGNIKINPSTGNAVISAKGKNVNTVFKEIFGVEKQPEVTLPYIDTISTSGLGNYETGTIVEPRFEFTANSGSYTYGPASSSTFDNFYAEFGGRIILANTGTFGNITVTDVMSSESNDRRIKIRGHFADDIAVPVSNLGNPCLEKQIKSGYTEYISSINCLKSYRQCFYESRTTQINLAMITSLFIRTLENKTGEYPTEDSEIEITFPIGMKGIIFAVPQAASSNIKVIDRNLMGLDVIEAFQKTIANVKDASNSNEIPYCVYFKNCAEPNDTENVYTVKFKD